MSDRIDREIDEILERLGGDPKSSPGPIPISSARRHQQRRPTGSSGSVLPHIEPAVLMFSGAAVMLVGLLLSAVAGLFIWAAFAGVLMFIAAFLISFARGWPRPGQRGGNTPRGVFWRDRYIEYDTTDASGWSRIKRRLRR